MDIKQNYDILGTWCCSCSPLPFSACRGYSAGCFFMREILY
nr:MAG TPA: Major transforming protein E5 family [Caudoviricetes sp.]DAQ59063.1 MAG TPA: Major transforming protein E5 family [Caudoviricetes sp.]